MFDAACIRDMMAHAETEYPSESCGLVVHGRYLPMPNLAGDPETDFRLEDAALLTPGAQAVVHSHPAGPDCPSEADMAAQMASDLPWGIVTVCPDGPRERGRARAPFWWGDQVPVAPLLGREFRHGVHDCYALARDWFRLARAVQLPDFPRPNEWWDTGRDLITEHFESAGFVRIDPAVLRPGDALAFAVAASVPNHCAVYIGEGLMLHHLYGRLSRTEPVGRWRKFLRLALRLEAGRAS